MFTSEFILTLNFVWRQTDMARPRSSSWCLKTKTNLSQSSLIWNKRLNCDPIQLGEHCTLQPPPLPHHQQTVLYPHRRWCDTHQHAEMNLLVNVMRILMQFSSSVGIASECSTAACFMVTVHSAWSVTIIVVWMVTSVKSLSSFNIVVFFPIIIFGGFLQPLCELL